MRILSTLQSSAFPLNLQYHLLFLRSKGSCLLLFRDFPSFLYLNYFVFCVLRSKLIQNRRFGTTDRSNLQGLNLKVVFKPSYNAY